MTGAGSYFASGSVLTVTGAILGSGILLTSGTAVTVLGAATGATVVYFSTSFDEWIVSSSVVSIENGSEGLSFFFVSFSHSPYPAADAVRRAYGSEANFLNEVYKQAMSLPYGFLLFYSFGGRIVVRECTDLCSAYYRSAPVLALDVCEHVYFSDYGFDKERYLLAALPYLDLTRLTESP